MQGCDKRALHTIIAKPYGQHLKKCIRKRQKCTRTEFYNARQHEQESMSNWISRLEQLRTRLLAAGAQRIEDNATITKLLGSSNRHSNIVTRYWHFEALRKKSDQNQQMIKVISQWERQSDQKLKILEIDGGTEYLDNTSKDLYESLGIEVITSIR